MAELSANLPSFTTADLPERMSQQDVEANRFTEAALVQHKREGLELAVRTRWAALAVIAVLLLILNPAWEMLYYHGLLIGLALVGWMQRRVGRVGRSRAELALLLADLALMTFALVFPNPFASGDWPTALIYKYNNFSYFYVILAGGTLAYSWRTIFAMGIWTTCLWGIAASLIWWFGRTIPELSEAAQTAFGHDRNMLELLDPNIIHWDARLQEVVVFVIVAITLGFSVRRFNRLLLSNAGLERERANLSRYFSPNVVDELSRNDEPLKQIRAHDVAVMFVDIVGFTEFAARRDPGDVIDTLRGFHGRLESEVFKHGGTLDKFLGDGMMATFGTPEPKPNDATRALTCARQMLIVIDLWNGERRASGLAEIRVSIGVHFGPVVLGDIGANRLEFAVIGNTVNVASRLEALSRPLNVHLVTSAALRERVIWETSERAPALAGLIRQPPQDIRGLDDKLEVWTLE
ncbi:MAG: adenylate/guanylate cyclase domain-containing protein [Sedimentitalea sp.]